MLCAFPRDFRILEANTIRACRVLSLAAPSIIFLVSGFGVQTVAIVFISRVGQLQLSAAVLASSVFNTTGMHTTFLLVSYHRISFAMLCWQCTCTNQTFGQQQLSTQAIRNSLIVCNCCAVLCIPRPQLFDRLCHPKVVAGLSLIYGLAGGMDTLCGQVRSSMQMKRAKLHPGSGTREASVAQERHAHMLKCALRCFQTSDHGLRLLPCDSAASHADTTPMYAGIRRQELPDDGRSDAACNGDILVQQRTIGRATARLITIARCITSPIIG